LLDDRSREELMDELISLRRENQALKANVSQYRQIEAELNESHQKLRLSEERFRLALANSPMLVFNQDQELRYIWIQKPLRGFSLEEVLGKTDLELFPEDDVHLTEIKRWVLKTGICSRDEVRIKIKGEEKYFDHFVHPVFDAAGTVVGITCVSSDITERKHMEEALRQSERENSEILNSITNAFYSLDRELRFTYLNRAAEKMIGKPREEVIGRVVNEVFPTIRPEFLEIYRQVADENNPHHFENFFQSIQRWIDTSVYPSPNGVSVFFRDIHERKLLEQALRDSEERFSMAFMVSPIPMTISRQEDGMFIDVNDSFLQSAGYSRGEIIGRLSVELKLWKDISDRAEVLGRLQRGEKVREVEIKYCTKKGKGIALLSMEPIVLNNTQCIVTMLNDITERRQMEKDLARLDRLSLVGEMAASIGHEIRNPMTAVRGFIQLLSEQEHYAKDKMYFDLMIEELDRANGIISEYLGMARDKIIDLQPQYLDQVIKAIYPMLAADANYKGMQIELDLGRPPMPLIDVKEIRQLILNMARNGLEAMEPYGTLTIGTTTEEGEIVMFIKDQGEGLPEELLDKLGTPFVTTKDNGTGLGLAICYSIAARHNARIDFETSVQGTTFYVRFPLPMEQTP